MNNCDWEETQNAAITKLEADLDDPSVTWSLIRDFNRARSVRWEDAPRSVLSSSTEFFIGECAGPTEGDKSFLRAMLRGSVLNYEHNERIANVYKKGVDHVRCTGLTAQLAYKPAVKEEKVEEAAAPPEAQIVLPRPWWRFWR